MLSIEALKSIAGQLSIDGIGVTRDEGIYRAFGFASLPAVSSVQTYPLPHKFILNQLNSQIFKWLIMFDR